MAITYPLSLPAGDIAAVTLHAHNVVGVSESPFTLQGQVQRHQGQRWAAEIDLPPLMGAARAAPWIAFLLSLRGRYGTFLLGDPARRTPRGVATGTPVVGGASQTGETLVTGGWTPSTPGILLEGDYIQLGSGASARLYALLTDADSDAFGNATIDIWPRLRESPGNTTSIITLNPVGQFRLASNTTDWSWKPPMQAAVKFSAVEAL